MRDETRIIFYGFLVILLGCLFMAISLNQAQNSAVAPDSAQNAVVAKNIAKQGKYATSYHEWQLFDQKLTTGPTQILPLALAIKVVGNSYSLPLEVSAFLNGFLLLLCLLILLRSFEQKGAWLIFSTIFISFALLFENKYWFSFTPEITLILLCLLSSGLLSMNNKFLNVAAGVSCALAILLNPLAILFAVGAVFYLVVMSRDIKSIAQFLTGMLVLLFIWQVYKQLQTGLSSVELEGYFYFKQEKAFLLADYFSTTDFLTTLKDSILSSHSVLVVSLAKYGLHYAFYIVLLLLTLISTIFSFTAIKKGHESFSGILAFCLFTVMLWLWFFIVNFSSSSQFSIYPLMASVIAVTWFCLATRSKINFVPILFLAAAIFFMQESRLVYAGDLLMMKAEKSSYKSGFLDVQKQLEKLKPDSVLAACGEHTAPWLMEYALQDSLNFSDCYRVINSSENKFESFVLMQNKPLWRVKTNDSNKNRLLLTYCNENEPIFENIYYALLQCKVNVDRFRNGRAAQMQKKPARITPGVKSPTTESTLKDSSGDEVKTRSRRKIGKSAHDR